MSRNIKVILLEPNKLARVSEIDSSLSGMQKIVGGLIEPVYCFEDPVCIVVNEEGKLLGLDINRGIFDQNKTLLDVIMGTAFICDCSGERFDSLSDEMISKYLDLFKYPDAVFNINGKVVCVPIIDAE